MFLLLFINIPSIIKNHIFSYDDKPQPTGVKSNWVQRQYLWQLMVNSGELAFEQHPSWDQTDAYLLKNGSNSLPDSTTAAMFFDYKITITEFFKNFGIVVFQSIRQTGIIVLTICLLLIQVFFKKTNAKSLYVSFICFFMIAIFSLIIISNVETRWLIPVFIMAIVRYSELELQNKLPINIIITNYLAILLMIFYGTYKVLQKMYY